MKYRKFQFTKRFNFLEKEVNKMAYFKRARIEPTSAQIERYNRAKRLLNVMNKRYPVIATKIEQNVSLKVIITKLERVENTDAEFLAMGIVAFQLVKFTYNFYGSETVSFLDTKIMKDGKQIVIDGDGFTAAGTEIK